MLMKTYNRFPVTFVRGSGCRLYDENGKEYLDFSSGIGVNSVGHAHPKWVAAVSAQAETLAHTSNLYYSTPGQKLAEKLIVISGFSGGSVFFANSGAEANEGMIKLARKYSRDKYGDGRATIVSLKQSFHGRTVTTLAATGQDKLHKHFQPFTAGFEYAPAGDIEALEALGDDICAVIAEVIQGEGGVLPLSDDYLTALADLCAKRDWLLMLDEVQTGIGRTGSWFAYQGIEGLAPDAVSFAKGIGGGLPIGGFIASEKCAGVLGEGDHGSTFGGNPLCCSAALAVLEILEEELPRLAKKGERLMDGLRGIDGLSGVRGKGLMLGADINERLGTPRELVLRLLDLGAVCLTAGSGALRLLPPLIISDEEIESGLVLIKKACQEA